MKIISSKTWSDVKRDIAEKIKNWLIKNGGTEKTVGSSYEVWRIKYSDVTITYYASGKLFCTDSNDQAIVKIHKYIYSLVGSQFIQPTREYLLGFDETGKGEVIGHTILVGVLIPADLYTELEIHIGTANTKVKHEFKYWDEIYRKIDYYTKQGLKYIIQKIPPWQIDKYNINKIFDITYQRILNQLIEGLEKQKLRIVLDDYGVGFHLNKFLKVLENSGAEVIKTTKADNIYLEARVASIISKREQQRLIDAISRNPEYEIPGKPIGSGNAGDKKTIEWLKAWKKTGKDWPWFVKRSFKTIREIDGITEEPIKTIPPIDENLLSEEFIKKFESGELNITSLSLLCPYCGTTFKLLKLIPRNQRTTPVCPNCDKELENVSLTLQYYCGKIVPDSSAICRGFISKDLEGAKFFENFTFIIHPIVRYETDQHKGGKAEIEKLGKLAAIGRIRLEEMPDFLNKAEIKESTHKDDAILEGARRYNAILLTSDKNMRGIAQTKKLFVIAID